MLTDRDYMRPGMGRRFGAQESVLKPLIWANVIVFLLTSFSGGSRGPLSELLCLAPDYIRGFEVWRLGTYMFVHANLMHILFNMWGLFIFGRLVEHRLGPTRFLYLYMISGLSGGLAWLAANWSSGIPVVGASGAVFGVTIAAAVIAPNQMIVLLFPPIPMRLKTFVAVFMGIEIFQAWSKSRGNIAHLAHLGGAVAGYIYVWRALSPNSGFRGAREDLRRQWRKWAAARTRAKFRPVEQDEEDPEQNRRAITSEVDRILDKIGREGLNQLTREEKQTLDQARERLLDRE